MEKFELVKESFNVSAKAGLTWLSLDMSVDCSVEPIKIMATSTFL